MKRSYLIDFINKYSATFGNIPEAAVKLAGIHLEALNEWSGVFNLVAEMPDEEKAESLYLDSMIVASKLAAVTTGLSEVHDVGSGAGFPGLFLPPFFGPETRFVLHESRRRRANFLKTAARAMGLENVSVSNRRVKAGAFSGDLIISRATFPPAEWLAVAATLARSGGRVVLLRSGSGAPENIVTPENLELERCLDYRLPVSGRNRAIVIYLARPAR